MIDVIIGFLTENAVALGGGAAAVAIIETVFKPIRTIAARWNKPETVALDKPSLDALAPKDDGKLTVVEFIRIRREMKADLEQELTTAHEGEKAELSARIAELKSQIANPDAALAEAQERIKDLEMRLERMGNEIGGDRLSAARAAFQKLDYSVADDIFAEIEDSQKLEVQQAARAAYGRGEVAEAEVRWHDAADHYARAARLDPTYETRIRAGLFLHRAGRYAEAIEQEEALLHLTRAVIDAKDPRYGTAINNLATSYCAAGDYAKAELLMREALTVTEQALGKQHAAYATQLNNLAELLRETGRSDAAEPLYREALAVAEQALGKQHADYATHLNNLALLLRTTGRYDAAEPLFREALAVREQALGKQHADYANSLNNLALLLDSSERYEEAEPLYREAVQVVEAALGPDHPHTQVACENLQKYLDKREDQ